MVGAVAALMLRVIAAGCAAVLLLSAPAVAQTTQPTPITPTTQTAQPTPITPATQATQPTEPIQTTQTTLPLGIHLGVATCAGSNCHGALERPPGSYVRGNEYLIWSKRDKHRQAYTVLLQEPAIRMARALGLPDAAHQKVCLDCHADDVPPQLRGAQFQISDGVGCESCHGGASGWLGIHISGATHQQNIAAGLYPTDQPIARAEKCLSCHFGGSNKFVTHRLYGAGHPRLTFELDTYTAMEPAHFVVDQSYIARNGRVTDLQLWATGQAVALVKQMDALIDPKNAPHGPFPEFALFDCQSCHHAYQPLHGPRPTDTGLGPGTVKLYDASAVMLHVAAARVAPAAAKSLAMHMLALQKASTEDWPAVQREAAAVRAIARSLVPLMAHYNFTREDMAALFKAEIALGTGPDNWQYSHAEQITMGLEALVTNLKSSGYVEDGQADAMTTALGKLYMSFPTEESFRPELFAKALKSLQPGLGR